MSLSWETCPTSSGKVRTSTCQHVTDLLERAKVSKPKHFLLTRPTVIDNVFSHFKRSRQLKQQMFITLPLKDKGSLDLLLLLLLSSSCGRVTLHTSLCNGIFSSPNLPVFAAREANHAQLDWGGLPQLFHIGKPQSNPIVCPMCKTWACNLTIWHVLAQAAHEMQVSIDTIKGDITLHCNYYYPLSF